jgi:ABC-2 type transport system ATP-binding protein
MTETPAAAVEVAHLVKRYRGSRRNAVDDISFDVPQGQLFCILGPNGAGKTTTVSILTTTLAPTSGRVRIAGRDLESQQAQVRGELGVVCQQPSLDLNLTAEENIRLHAVLYGLYPWRPRYRLMPASYRGEVQEMAAVLDISGSLGRRARTLSGGQRRRLEIVRALMHRPRVLFLDEPTAGLDPASRRGLWAYLRQERARSGVTVILTTHYLEEAESADSVCVLAGGTIIERGSPAEVKERQLNPQLVLDAADRAGLRRELESLGVQVSVRQIGANQPAGPLRVPLNGRSAQDIIASVRTNLTRFQIAEPTLEDAYLSLLDRAGIRPAISLAMSRPASGRPRRADAALIASMALRSRRSRPISATRCRTPGTQSPAPAPVTISALPFSCPGMCAVSSSGVPQQVASAMVPGPALVTIRSQHRSQSLMLSTKPVTVSRPPDRAARRSSRRLSAALRPRTTTT